MRRLSAFFLLSIAVVFSACDDGGSNGKAGEMAFHSDRDGNFEIYLMSESGGNLERVTLNTIPDRNPALATTGTLVFTAEIESFLQTVIVEADTFRNVTGQALDDRAPSISADGNRLAFIRNEDVYVMNVDGSGLLNLTNSGPGDANDAPSFSSDGSLVVFSRSVSGGFSEIYTVGADGSGLTNITNSADHDDVSPSYSGDDAKIVFVRDRHVSVMNADGSEIIDLMPGDTSVYNGHPVFSEDGGKIAFSSDRTGDREIFVMKADGSDVINVTSNPAEDDHPAWRK